MIGRAMSLLDLHVPSNIDRSTLLPTNPAARRGKSLIDGEGHCICGMHDDFQCHFCIPVGNERTLNGCMNPEKSNQE